MLLRTSSQVVCSVASRPETVQKVHELTPRVRYSRRLEKRRPRWCQCPGAAVAGGWQHFDTQPGHEEERAAGTAGDQIGSYQGLHTVGNRLVGDGVLGKNVHIMRSDARR